MTVGPLLVAEALTKSYGSTQALRDGRLEVRAGEVHALVGENGAGKSTLMNILAGIVQPDAGTLHLSGEPMRFAGPRDAARRGVGIVHQELALCPDVTVAENLFMSEPPVGRFGLLDFDGMRERAQEYLSRLQTPTLPTDRVGDLPIGQQQVVEIVRAIAQDCRVVIFDEPTSSLTETESAALFGVIRDLRSRGIGVVYISHRMSEVFDLADRITVMRDGMWVATVERAATSPEQVISLMVGRDVLGLYPEKRGVGTEPVLTVEHLSGARFQDVSFTAHRGEILGFSGLVGSGRTEVLRAVCAIDRPVSGSVRLAGTARMPRSYREAIDGGLCYMTEDRKLDGLFLPLSIEANTVVAVLPRVSRRGVVSRRLSRGLALDQLEELRTRMGGPEQPVSSLSGGNQQKVMIAKWLVAQPKVLVLDEPTRGIDVGAKHEIHELLRTLADAGMSVIVISSDLPEVVGLSDRLIVMREGSVAGELAGDDISEDAVIAYASAIRAA